MTRLMQSLFHLLYTRFAGSYDTVAKLASLGEWRAWGALAVNHLPPAGPVLELGPGPGHLHRMLRERGRRVAGIDLSPQMTRIAASRLARGGFDCSVARAAAAGLPFADRAFTAAVSTFPAPFIYDPRVLAEVHRVLQPGGVLVVVAHADVIGATPGALLLRAAYAATGQTGAPFAAARARFAKSGFDALEHLEATARARVHVWTCRTIPHP